MLTVDQYTAANQKQSAITQIEDILTVYPSEDPDPVTLSDITAIVTAINEKQPSFIDSRIIEAVQEALGACYNSIRDNLNTVKDTITIEFENIGSQLTTPTSFVVNTTGLASWGATPYPGTTFVLERATNSGFTTDLSTRYTGTELTYQDTELVSTIHYYYRLKATALGYTDSDFATTDIIAE